MPPQAAYRSSGTAPQAMRVRFAWTGIPPTAGLSTPFCDFWHKSTALLHFGTRFSALSYGSARLRCETPVHGRAQNRAAAQPAPDGTRNVVKRHFFARNRDFGSTGRRIACGRQRRIAARIPQVYSFPEKQCTGLAEPNSISRGFGKYEGNREIGLQGIRAGVPRGGLLAKAPELPEGSAQPARSCTEIRGKWTKSPAFSVSPGLVGAVAAVAGMNPPDQCAAAKPSARVTPGKDRESGTFCPFPADFHARVMRKGLSARAPRPHPRARAPRPTSLFPIIMRSCLLSVRAPCPASHGTRRTSRCVSPPARPRTLPPPSTSRPRHAHSVSPPARPCALSAHPRAPACVRAPPHSRTSELREPRLGWHGAEPGRNGSPILVIRHSSWLC